MLKIIKRLGLAFILLALIATATVYGVLTMSLPALDGKGQSKALSDTVKIKRDNLGQAVIQATNRLDAAYALGFAHGQDRFFQMDLLRRNAAGELSEIFGAAALEYDKKMRFHQLRQRSQFILQQLPKDDQVLLDKYTQGVNEGLAQVGFASFEYLLTGATQQPWRSEDSLLVIFSMYLDLQTATFERDKTLIQIEQLYSPQMVAFLTQPSRYQAALDNSKLAPYQGQIPKLSPTIDAASVAIADSVEVGSNNWAVTGQHTRTGAGMLSDDMHLSFAVPIIWYRAQLNYQLNDQPYQVTGVSLPGAPAIVVGTNDHIAWGFTNGYLDTADWVAIANKEKTWQVEETIQVAGQDAEKFAITMSEYGPVQEINGKPYALSWVAHHNYAVNMKLIALEQAQSVDDALTLASQVAIPVQNLMVVDRQGNAAWKNMGAIPARSKPSVTAISEQDYSPAWHDNELVRPMVKNPTDGRLWTGNSRVVSATDNMRFGNGGYALGARSSQIRDRLYEKEQFDEADFMQIQLDNEARFLKPWHQLLLAQLMKQPDKYQRYISQLNNWQACACEGSVGYTLVRRFRDEVINVVFSRIENQLNEHDGSIKTIKRDVEPALWQLINEQPKSWLKLDYASWHEQLLAAFDLATEKLTAKHGEQLTQWRWGNENELVIDHPFAKQLPVLKKFLNMPIATGHGDSFMPAVQGRSFGASQRFIVQPGFLDNAIMTIPGGQSGHPLSPFYRAGFNDFAEHKATPLLPQQMNHEITLVPDQPVE